MRGNPVALGETLDNRLGASDLHLLFHQTMGNAVKKSFKFKVIINKHPGLLPSGNFLNKCQSAFPIHKDGH
jgi:hypothetical protein